MDFDVGGAGGDIDKAMGILKSFPPNQLSTLSLHAHYVASAAHFLALALESESLGKLIVIRLVDWDRSPWEMDSTNNALWKKWEARGVTISRVYDSINVVEF